MKILNGICKLCLEKCESFKAIDENTKNALSLVLPKVDFSLIQELVMCKECAEMLTKCYEFKIKCLRTQDYIIPFAHKDNVDHDLKNFYTSKKLTGVNIPEDEVVCGLCMGVTRTCSAVYFNTEDRDIMLQKMIEQCLPELDLSIIKKLGICPPCYESLESCFCFVRDCLIAEEKIKNYYEFPEIKSKGQMEQDSLSQFIIRDVTKMEGDANSAGMIKVKEQLSEDKTSPDEREIGRGGDIIKLEQICFGSEDANEDVKNKNASFMEQKVKDEHRFKPNDMWVCEDESNKLSSIKKEEIFYEENETTYKEETIVEMEDQKCLLDEETETKLDVPDFIRFKNDVVFPQSEVSVDEKCSVLNLEGTASKLYKALTFTNENSTHLLSEVTIYNCDSCSFQTKSKCYLKYHSLKHKDPSEVIMYKCDSCSFQTMKKYNLKIHDLTHKDPLDVTMYKCDSCSFQTKRKYRLTNHSLVHKSPLEIAMYKCDSCSFQTHVRCGLNKHMLKHKDPSEVTMYKCDSCSFQSKRNCALKKHLLRHMDPSQVTMYKCASCSFKTKTKYSLKEHLLQHKDPSEITMYKCETCSFQTKRKFCLTRHMSIYKHS